ncbi:UNVERIFIED_CONTAM: hypothetical protein FKN15_072828 [Acipenser sinensis]
MIDNPEITNSCFLSYLCSSSLFLCCSHSLLAPPPSENLERILEIAKLRAIQRKAHFAKLKICVYKEEMPVTPYERPLFNSLRFERSESEAKLFEHHCEVDVSFGPWEAVADVYDLLHCIVSDLATRGINADHQCIGCCCSVEGYLQCHSCSVEGYRQCHSCSVEGYRQCHSCSVEGYRQCHSCSVEGYRQCHSCSVEGYRQCHSCSVEGYRQCHSCSVEGYRQCHSCSVEGYRQCHSCSVEGYRQCHSCSVEGYRQCHSCSVEGYRQCHSCSVEGYRQCHSCSVEGYRQCHSCSVEGYRQCHSCSVEGYRQCHSCSVEGYRQCHSCSVEGYRQCHSCSVEGYRQCHSCSVEGYRQCHSCSVEGYRQCHSCSVEGYRQCHSCSVEGYLQCHSCSVEGYLQCHSCSVEGYLQCHSCSVEAARQNVIRIMDEVTLNQILDNPHYEREVRATVLAEGPVQNQIRKLLDLIESSELKSNQCIEIFFEVNSDLASKVGLKKTGPLMISYCHKQRDMVKRIADELKLICCWVSLCEVILADKRLFEVRTKFIEGVNVAIIQDLLDDMQHVKVLNDGEVEDVKEGQTRTKDKARCLIDMVRKKGAAASEKFISRIKERDPSLYHTLQLDSQPGG